MKLGSKSKDVDSFVDKLRSEGTGEDSKQYNYQAFSACPIKPQMCLEMCLIQQVIIAPVGT